MVITSLSKNPQKHFIWIKKVVIVLYETRISERVQIVDILSHSYEWPRWKNTSTLPIPPSTHPMPNTWSNLESNVSYEKSHTVSVLHIPSNANKTHFYMKKDYKLEKLVIFHMKLITNILQDKKWHTVTMWFHIS